MAVNRAFSSHLDRVDPSRRIARGGAPDSAFIIRVVGALVKLRHGGL